METRPKRGKNVNLATTLREARSGAINPLRGADARGGHEDASTPPVAPPAGRICPKCKARMAGPWWEGDDRAAYRVWLCQECGYRCERFAFEWSSEEPVDPFTRVRGRKP